MASPLLKFKIKNPKSPEGTLMDSVNNEFSETSALGDDNSYITQEHNLMFKAGQSQGGEDGEALWLLSYSDMMTLLFGFFVLLMSFSKIDVDAFEKVRKETTLTFGGEYKKPFTDLKEKLSEKVQGQGLTDKAFFDEFEKGITITFRGSVFFQAGSTELLPEAKTLLENLIPVVQSKSSHFNVVVEGHTDDTPIHSELFASNWELSAQRASAVIRLFESHGFGRAHLRAIGYADTMPVVPNRDKAGIPIPDNQSQNRRVVIKLVRSKK